MLRVEDAGKIMSSREDEKTKEIPVLESNHSNAVFINGGGSSHLNDKETETAFDSSQVTVSLGDADNAPPPPSDPPPPRGWAGPNPGIPRPEGYASPESREREYLFGENKGFHGSPNHPDLETRWIKRGSLKTPSKQVSPLRSRQAEDTPPTLADKNQKDYRVTGPTAPPPPPFDAREVAPFKLFRLYKEMHIKMPEIIYNSEVDLLTSKERFEMIRSEACRRELYDGYTSLTITLTLTLLGGS